MLDTQQNELPGPRAPGFKLKRSSNLSETMDISFASGMQSLVLVKFALKSLRMTVVMESVFTV